MLILIGASASGKTIIAKELVNKYGYEKMITTTTRRKRKNEINHVDYHFVTRKRFETMVEKNQFLEHVEYNHNYYGTPTKGAENTKVLIVEPEGANSIYDKGIKDNIFVLLETDEETRKIRMLERGDTLIQIIDRLEKDDRYFSESHLKHIDMKINTSDKTIDELTKHIHNFYQDKIQKIRD